jgi:hypothetical protein
MALEFVRYSAGVEIPEPTFNDSLKKILDRSSHYTTESVPYCAQRGPDLNGFP